MNIPLPLFVAVPLATAFVLPIFSEKNRWAATVLANIAAAALLVFAVLSLGRTDVYEVGGWSIPLGINLVLDGLSSLMLLTVAVVSLAAVVFGIGYMGRYTAIPKYLSLFMLMVAGMNGVVLSGDIFNLFVFLEIASIASYALVGFGCEHEQLEAAFKYMVLGSVASMFILFAVGLVYGMTGSLNMAVISVTLRGIGQPLPLPIMFALAMFIAGFGLKAALVPFHAWLPDAHPAAPAPISAMLSGVLIKTLGAYAIARIIFNVFGITEQTAWVLLALGLLSMVTGAFLAIGQWDLKRLLAYSSISQLGYVVMGFGLGGLILATGGSRFGASLALAGACFHLANHAVYKSLLFLVSGSIETATGTRQIKEMGGLIKKMPVTGSACMIASASIVGIPPFSGFWSKLILVVAAVRGGFTVIAAIIIFVSILTLIMYLKVQRYVFLGEVPENLRDIKETRGSMAFAMCSLACLCVVMGLLFLVPSLRRLTLDPAAKVLTEGLTYTTNIIAK